MLFVTNQDSAQLRAITHGMAIEFASLHALCITSFALGQAHADEVLPLLAEMIKWEDPDGIDRLLRRRLATYETEALARLPMRAWPQKRAALEDMYSKGCMRAMEIQQRVFPATVISSQRTCNPGSFQLLGHDALELWSMWSYLGSAEPDLSSVQFFETVGMVLDEVSCGLDPLLLDGEVKRAITRGVARCMTLDDGEQKRFKDVSEFILWLS